ncbi:putative toxin-antitoxin system toxin component, PIN family [Undibacterium sp. Jales W-56]|uniref:putative toxin-antitoxin system toxin component, PIN family n=1 Tax=Undibacterium sp. Jales W-56 TaxID=2897325 RepID=UPI0021CE300E|nr:putative toxin-antitoxin system toxin component, PIN family [Undibacterium sp. Jales W-56]MCU6433488.1 putative toxin-antitoxin system toxin component, PIN family [Undibacterium sp. Jales W-56]
MIPKRVVLDTNVCLDLFVFHDPRWIPLMNGLNDGSIKAVTCEDCRQEWLVVLTYPHLPIQEHHRDGIIQEFDRLVETQILPEALAIKLPVCSDKDDQKFLEAARDARVDVLVTKDKALLKLARKTRQLGLYEIETPDKFILKLVQGVL